MVAVAGDVYTLKLAGADTGGRCSLLEFVVPPGGGPPPHVHTREDEAFYVTAGELTFTVGGDMPQTLRSIGCPSSSKPW